MFADESNIMQKQFLRFKVHMQTLFKVTFPGLEIIHRGLSLMQLLSDHKIAHVSANKNVPAFSKYFTTSKTLRGLSLPSVIVAGF